MTDWSLPLLIMTFAIACIIAFLLRGSTSSASAFALKLHLRHGGQLTTDAPSMNEVTKEENAAVKTLHASSPYFHNGA